MSFMFPSRKPQQLTLILVAGFSLLHLLVIGRFGLSGDEAHYALYGLHLDWSYFDHPPLVGWLQSLVLLFSESNFALRFWPVILSVLSSWLLFRLVADIYPGDAYWSAFIAVALLQGMLVFQILSLAMLPDTPLLAAGLATAWLCYRILEENRQREWLLLGAVLGLAGLAKYTAILLVPSVLVLVLLSRGWRYFLGSWPWFGAILGIMLIFPVFYWNWQHDWVSFAYQLGHGLPDRSWQMDRFLISAAGQIIAYGPLITLLAPVILLLAARQQLSTGVQYALIFGFPYVLFFAWSSGFKEVLPHWTMFGWALIIPPIAHWLISHWAKLWIRTVSILGLSYGFVLALILHTELFFPWMPFQEHKYPFADLYGWEQAVAQARMHRDAMLDSRDGGAVLFSGNWSYTSHIAWRARPDIVQTLTRTGDQHHIWFGVPDDGAQGILIVPASMRRSASAWRERFSECVLLEEVPYLIRGQLVTSFDLYMCSDFKRG